MTYVYVIENAAQERQTYIHVLEFGSQKLFGNLPILAVRTRRPATYTAWICIIHAGAAVSVKSTCERGP